MKKLSIIFSAIFLLVGFYSIGQTRSYHSFPDDAYWRVDSYAWDTFTGCEEDYYYHYYLNGDTIINAKTYKKLFRSPVEIIPQGGGAPCYVWPWATFTGYMGALRDDPIDNKVYFINPDQNNDTLFFDYNLLVGETIEGMLTANCTMTISTIDTVLVGNDYRKKWNFTTCNEGEGYFIQGIGSDNGLIEWINSWGFTSTHLVCVKTNEQILYETDWNSAVGCVLITSVEDNINTELNPKFYPNPFSQKTTLLTNRKLQNATLIVSNSTGQSVKYIQNLCEEKVTISRGDLTRGLYFYQLNERNKTIASGKLIVIDK